MAHPNEELLRRAYEAFGKGDIDTVLGAFDDNIVWHVPGRNPIAGDYKGKAEVTAFFGKIFELSGGTFKLEVHDVLANDEHAVALVHLRADRAGRTYDANETHVTHIRDGRITEFWAVSTDQQAWDELLTA